jgi:hypothetical protein
MPEEESVRAIPEWVHRAAIGAGILAAGGSDGHRKPTTVAGRRGSREARRRGGSNPGMVRWLGLPHRANRPRFPASPPTRLTQADTLR